MENVESGLQGSLDDSEGLAVHDLEASVIL